MIERVKPKPIDVHIEGRRNNNLSPQSQVFQMLIGDQIVKFKRALTVLMPFALAMAAIMYFEPKALPGPVSFLLSIVVVAMAGLLL